MEILSLRRITMLKITEEHRLGYLDTETCHYQMLCKAVYLLGLRIFRWTYFYEKVPNWAIYQKNCIGSTDWKSQRPNLIDYHTKNKYIFRYKV